MPVLRVLGQTSEGQSLWTCRTDQPLVDLLELMAKGVHRVLVLPAQSSHQQVVNLLYMLCWASGSNEY